MIKGLGAKLPPPANFAYTCCYRHAAVAWSVRPRSLLLLGYGGTTGWPTYRFCLAFLVLLYSIVVVSGKLRYANNSNYKNDTMIRKEVCCELLNNLSSILVCHLKFHFQKMAHCHYIYKHVYWIVFHIFI